MTSAPARRVRVVVRGRVQGVGFRFWTTDTAYSAGLSGWVRNRDDGAVEAELEGAPDAVDGVLAALRQGPPLAHVTAVHAVDVPARGGSAFVIER
ncbi:acylphosphatase [Xylanimonas ulmi]|uniref:Acylphosphatase n=1 Tax=Xylanimonas ulmi TaxID=228973 RepID=A0A4Q7LZI1_9MICO|nr:acylphosphatase [Xylanibacterium ulmi]RZS60835.1 acylphosphatase [Xylanibacterium ulmi]